MRPRLRFPVFNDCLEHCRECCHDGRLECNLYILMLMGRNAECFRLQLKGELLSLRGVSFANIQFDIAGDLVWIGDLEFLNDSIREFGGDQCSEEEGFLFNCKDGGVNHGRYGGASAQRLDDDLFFENGFVILAIDARDATLSDDLINYTIWLVLRVSPRNINAELLFKYFLMASIEVDLNHC